MSLFTLKEWFIGFLITIVWLVVLNWLFDQSEEYQKSQPKPDIILNLNKPCGHTYYNRYCNYCRN